MTSVFNALSSASNAILGAAVLVEPASGLSETIRGIFRREPIEVDGGNGALVLIPVPTLKIRRDQALLARGDEVLPLKASGERFRIVNCHPGRSPASNSFVIYELELVE